MEEGNFGRPGGRREESKRSETLVLIPMDPIPVVVPPFRELVAREGLDVLGGKEGAMA